MIKIIAADMQSVAIRDHLELGLLDDHSAEGQGVKAGRSHIEATTREKVVGVEPCHSL